MEKTAVECLIEKLQERGYIFEKKENVIIEKAKEMEKEQAEKMYSEEEVYNLLCQFPNKEELDNWFEQNKKK